LDFDPGEMLSCGALAGVCGGSRLGVHVLLFLKHLGWWEWIVVLGGYLFADGFWGERQNAS